MGRCIVIRKTPSLSIGQRRHVMKGGLTHLREHILWAPNAYNEIVAALAQRHAQVCQRAEDESGTVGARLVKAARQLLDGWQG